MQLIRGQVGWMGQQSMCQTPVRSVYVDLCLSSLVPIFDLCVYDATLQRVTITT